VTLSLRRLREDELSAFRESSERGYVESIEHAGGMTRELAVEKARRDFDALWPDGRPVPGQLFYAIEKDGERVGYLWLAERDNQGRRVVWVYDVEIDEPHRGRGLGRQAMLLAEEETRALGLSRIELNVFGGNEVARNLYRSLAYEELAVWMGKDLT
jgi:GNAT superfamily N-acetyltransferase